MLRSLVLCGLALPACVDSGDSHLEGDVGAGETGGALAPIAFPLTKTRAMAGELPVAGIDGDRAGGLWIAYQLQPGGPSAPADVHVVHLDAEGKQRSEWQYNDETTPVSGLAFSGDAVWLNYSYSGGYVAGYSGDNHIRKLDPSSGHVLDTFALQRGMRAGVYEASLARRRRSSTSNGTYQAWLVRSAGSSYAQSRSGVFTEAAHANSFRGSIAAIA
jgi:hypothetical protein